MSLRIDLGNDRIVEMDPPPPEVTEALLRVAAALVRGGEPDRKDAELVFAWEAEQEAKYPTRWTAGP